MASYNTPYNTPKVDELSIVENVMLCKENIMFLHPSLKLTGSSIRLVTYSQHLGTMSLAYLVTTHESDGKYIHIVLAQGDSKGTNREAYAIENMKFRLRRKVADVIERMETLDAKVGPETEEYEIWSDKGDRGLVLEEVEAACGEIQR